jgi:hypothetical protein
MKKGAFDGTDLNILSGTIDRYKGIVIKDFPSETQQFAEILARSEQVFIEKKLRSIWLKMSKKHSHLVGCAV